jgi:pimeloyl-ACP methyl ester carboxylesterase
VRAADAPNMRVWSATRASNSASPPAASSAPVRATASQGREVGVQVAVYRRVLVGLGRHCRVVRAEHPAKEALGFQRNHVVADAGHSVQGDQPAALVAILRELAGA